MKVKLALGEDLILLIFGNRTRWCIFLILSLFCGNLINAQNVNDDFSGRWKAPKGAIIIVSKNADGFVGRTEKEKAIVLKDVNYANDKWVAIVLNPKEKIVARCELMLEKNQLKIIVRKGVLYKTITWIKQ